MPEQVETTKPRKRSGPYNYLVCRIDDGCLIPLTSAGEDASEKWPPELVRAASPAKAREWVFRKLTQKQPATERDAYSVPLVAIREGNLGFQQMAWNVTRKVAS